MKKLAVITVIIAGVLSAQFSASAQFKTKNAPADTTKTETQLILEAAETAEAPALRRKAHMQPCSLRLMRQEHIRGRSRSR